MTTWLDGYVTVNGIAVGNSTVNGIRLHYHRTGGDKPPLVMAHGITDNGLCWSPLARALEDDFDLIMVDARGHGLSDKPPSGYSALNNAEDLAGLLAALGLQQAIVIGHSMGGQSSALMASLYPHLVSRLILEDPGWFPPEVGTVRDAAHIEAGKAVFEERMTWRQAHSLEEVTAATRHANPLWTDAEFPAHSEAKHQVSPHVLQIVGTPSTPWWEVVAGLRCPTLVLTGETERGAIITEGMAQTIHTLNPLVEVVRLAGTGHNVRRDDFNAFLAAVRAFLDEGAST